LIMLQHSLLGHCPLWQGLPQQQSVRISKQYSSRIPKRAICTLAYCSPPCMLLPQLACTQNPTPRIWFTHLCTGRRPNALVWPFLCERARTREYTDADCIHPNPSCTDDHSHSICSLTSTHTEKLTSSASCVAAPVQLQRRNAQHTSTSTAKGARL
jgi:hypothetical protein